jgi:hypothetical protein
MVPRPSRRPLAGALLVLLLGLGASAGGFDFEPRWAARSAATGDLDGDGSQDVVFAETLLSLADQRGRVVVFLGAPSTPGRWRSRTVLRTGAAPLGVRLADLDGNGRLDIVTANGAGGTVTVLLQDLAGNFQGTDFPATTRPIAVAVGDLDGDALPDLAVAGRRDAVVLFQDPGAPGALLPPVLLAPGVDPSCVTVADLDGAGGNDVLLGLTDGVGHLLQVPGVPGTFAALGRIDIPGRTPGGIAATDLDGDGRTDLACAMEGLSFGRGGQGLGVLLQDPAGGLVFTSAVLARRRSLDNVEAVDMNGDAFPDLVVRGNRRVLSFLQDPLDRGTFLRGAHRYAGALEGGIATADFDGDGLPDIAAGFYGPVLVEQDPDRPRHFHRPRPYRSE